MYKKAQAAMEFLMTYGWAILVVLVAIGALAYFGVLSPDKMLPEKCIISSGSGLFCDKFSVTSTSIDLKIKNSLAEAVNITSIGVGTTCINTTNVELPADGSNTVQIVCSDYTAAGKVNDDITITYIDKDGFSKQTTGTLVARIV
jgi:hypothetical protein